MNRSIEFLNSIDSVYKREIPGTALKRASESLLDYLAVTCAGAKFQEEKLKKYYLFAEPEAGIFTAVGTGKKLALKDAVFLNGLNGHALDFDDGTNSGIIHLGSPVFSLLLPLAQRYDIGTGDMLKAAVTGYEASYSMAVSIQPEHKALGYHATGTCGVLGAAVAAAYMLGFSAEERFHAFSAACVSASGMLKALDGGSELKPYNVAKAALLALTSVQLAKAGFKGDPDPLGGNRGYFKMMTGNEDIDLKPVLLNGTYAVQKTYTKPYASCRYTHPSVEAAIRLRERYGIKAVDIERIGIKTYSLAVSGHDHTSAANSYSAKMSIPYSVAAGIIYGKAGLREFSEENIMKKDIVSLAEKVSIVSDDGLSKVFPELQPSIVSIVTVNGTFTERVDFPKGEPENPLSDKEFRERYEDLMGYAGIKRDITDHIFETACKPDSKVSELIGSL